MVYVQVERVFSQCRVLVTDDGPVRLAMCSARLKSHLPKTRISSEDPDAYSLIARCGHRLTHLPRPVLVMPNDQVRMMVQQDVGNAVDIHIRQVSYVIAF